MAWVIGPPFRGGRGLDGLALSLSSAFKEAGRPRDLAAVRVRLAAAGNVRTLGNELLDAHGAPGGSVLLVLDQLEEVFATPDGSERAPCCGCCWMPAPMTAARSLFWRPCARIS